MTQLLTEDRPSLPVVERVLACCAPLSREPLSADGAVHFATLLKALADPARLRVMSIIMAAETGEVCVCDLTDRLDLTQPTVSHHLRVLLDAGLVRRDKRGVWAYYRAVPGALTALTELLSPVSGGATVAL